MKHEATCSGGPFDGETLHVDSIISINMLQPDGHIGLYVATSAERTVYEYRGVDPTFGSLCIAHDSATHNAPSNHAC